MRRLGLSRRQLFETVERPAMQALPQDDHEYAEWHLARVGIDYHVEVQGFFYSVPHALIREQVDTRATARTVEVFHHGKRVAAHQRRYSGPRHGTQPDHMPRASPNDHGPPPAHARSTPGRPAEHHPWAYQAWANPALILKH